MQAELLALLRGPVSDRLTGSSLPNSIAIVDLPQGALPPSIVFEVTSSSDTMTMQGPDGLVTGRVQIDCRAASYADAKAIAAAVICELNGFRSGNIRFARWDDTRESRSRGANDPDRLFVLTLDFFMSWRK